MNLLFADIHGIPALIERIAVMSNENVNRRGFLKKSIAASAGATFGLKSFEEQNLLAKMTENSADNKSKAAKEKSAGGKEAKSMDEKLEEILRI